MEMYMGGSKSYINRELRWLNFNERVLMTAENPETPLMERLKFVGIFSSNLDEFYAVRVGSLHRNILDPSYQPKRGEENPKKLLKQILSEVKRLNGRMDKIVLQLIKELKQHRINLVMETELNEVQKQYLDKFFTNKLRNLLFPVLLDPDLPFPYLKHVALYLAIHMYVEGNPKDCRYALIEVPTDMLSRYIRVPSRGGWNHFIYLEDVIRLKLKEIFKSFHYDTYNAYTIKITRDGEYDLADEVTLSLYEKLSASLKKRSTGDPVRFVYDKNLPDEMLSYLLKYGNLADCRIILPGSRYHNARDMMRFPKISNQSLYFTQQPPLPHHTLNANRSLIEQIEEKDHLISLPYHRYDVIIDLLREAALDNTVSSIKMTLYRVPENSNVINALRNAARNGKKVTIFIELQARFDEEINLHWTEKLSHERNIFLIGGIEGKKVHSKLCVITRLKGKKESRLAIIGTGNFNEDTASLYSDHLLLTSHNKITEEVSQLFDLLDQGFAEVKFKKLIVSPFHTRKRFVSLIKNEMLEAKEGREARIVLKLNNLVDQKMIGHLIRAEKTGVKIRLMVRGICSIALQDHQKNIEGKALIDRYLEHTRIIKFHNKGEPLYFIGSADWMERNLDNRIEVMVPVYSKEIQQELEVFLQKHWDDTYSSFDLSENSFNRSFQTGQPDEKRAQQDLYLHYKNLVEGNG